jgi:hypothetical protein
MSNPLFSKQQSIKDVDSYLLDQWARTILDKDITVTIQAPGEVVESKQGVNFYLIEIDQGLPCNSTGSSLNLELHYLVTTWAENNRDAHEILERLLHHVAEHYEEGFLYQLKPLAHRDWVALHAKPQPAFLLRYTVQIPLEETMPAPNVQKVVIEIDGNQTQVESSG